MDEITKDLSIDDFNIKESQMRLPARKHFWAARLIDTKINLNRLQQKEKDLKSKLAKKICEDSPIKLSTSGVDNLINEQDEMKQLHAQIVEHKHIIEYLEKVEKIMSTLHWEVKNIIELQKLEQT